MVPKNHVGMILKLVALLNRGHRIAIQPCASEVLDFAKSFESRFATFQLSWKNEISHFLVPNLYKPPWTEHAPAVADHSHLCLATTEVMEKRQAVHEVHLKGRGQKFEKDCRVIVG